MARRQPTHTRTHRMRIWGCEVCIHVKVSRSLEIEYKLNSSLLVLLHCHAILRRERELEMGQMLSRNRLKLNSSPACLLGSRSLSLCVRVTQPLFRLHSYANMCGTHTHTHITYLDSSIHKVNANAFVRMDFPPMAVLEFV